MTWALPTVARHGWKFMLAWFKPTADEYQYIIAFTTAFLDKVLGLLQKLAVPLLVQHIEEVLVRCVRLKMYVLDVLSVWPVKRN